MRTRTVALVIATGALLPGLSACAGSDGSGGTAAADCMVLSRYDGRVYAGWGRTVAIGRELGVADVSSCSDTGPEPAGAWFPDDPETAAVGTVAGFDPERVIALERGDRWELFVADDLPDAERDRILRAVRAARR